MATHLVIAALVEYEPPSLCHFGLELLGLGALGAEAAAGAGAATAATAAGVGGAAASGFATGVGSALGGAAAALPASTGIALPSLSTLGTVASLGGTLVQGLGQMQQAEYQAAVARSEAAAQRMKGEEAAAAAQRRQITNLRQAELVGSRARALSAASGTLATDPTQVDIESDIAQQGQYNALSALYEGMAASRMANYQADIDLFRARRYEAAMPFAVGGTLLSGLSGFADRRLRRNYLLDAYGS